jgi:hypothetical protein
MTFADISLSPKREEGGIPQYIYRWCQGFSLEKYIPKMRDKGVPLRWVFFMYVAVIKRKSVNVFRYLLPPS